VLRHRRRGLGGAEHDASQTAERTRKGVRDRRAGVISFGLSLGRLGGEDIGRGADRGYGFSAREAPP
jgi:hypothetical protein